MHCKLLLWKRNNRFKEFHKPCRRKNTKEKLRKKENGVCAWVCGLCGEWQVMREPCTVVTADTQQDYSHHLPVCGCWIVSVCLVGVWAVTNRGGSWMINTDYIHLCSPLLCLNLSPDISLQPSGPSVQPHPHSSALHTYSYMYMYNNLKLSMWAHCWPMLHYVVFVCYACLIQLRESLTALFKSHDSPLSVCAARTLRCLCQTMQSSTIYNISQSLTLPMYYLQHQKCSSQAKHHN